MSGYESDFRPPPFANLAVLLDAIEVFVRRFVVIDDAQATAVVLWIAHTWAIDAARATPYLFVCSVEPESGKTRMLEVFRELVRDALSTMNITDAALFRAIAAKRPTLLFDEVDAIFNPKARERGHRAEFASILNAGYRRGEVVYRMGGNNNRTLESFEVFGAKALAGLGNLPPTLLSRCLRIEVKRRKFDEPVEDFFPEEIADEATRLRDELELWAKLEVDVLKTSRPARIGGLRDRTNEVWRPLLAIAELAGDIWDARARRAALALAPVADEDSSVGVLLLSDIRTVFDQREDDRIATSDLLLALSRFDESPWVEWWIDLKTREPTKTASRRLAKLLRPFGINSKVVRSDGRVSRGYKREDFEDAWARFLPSSSSVASVTSVTPILHDQRDVTDVASVTDTRDGARSRFCDTCTSQAHCIEAHYCCEIARLARRRTAELS